jgi:hypothetical protein
MRYPCCRLSRAIRLHASGGSSAEAPLLGSQRSLASVQLSRNSFTELAESPAPLREAALESFRRRNAVMDALFYDVGKVTRAEAKTISPWLAREGALLIVPPTGQGSLRLCSSVDDFARYGGGDVRILTVAGVGSSALGSAAFARNVADGFRRPAAAVVSGYGLADLLTEAAGGWFWFGALNGLRHGLEQLDELSRRWSALITAESAAESSLPLPRLSLDTRMVCALLSDSRFRFTILSGHSKGNLVLSEGIYLLETAAGGTARALADDAWLIKFSAAVAMPPRFRNSIDVMGDIDWFGAINSRPGMTVEKRFPLSWHHTNTELPLHLPVTQACRELIESRSISFQR